jgi:hypothetical protein
VALIKTDYEEGRLQPTPAGHPHLASPNWPPHSSSLPMIFLKEKKIIQIDKKKLEKSDLD